MLSTDVHQEIAKKIFQCFRDHSQIPLLNSSYPELEVEDSYRIQEHVVAAFQAEGHRIKGHKIGLTSKTMQEMAGSSEPDYSAMLDHMFLDESSETLARAGADRICFDLQHGLMDCSDPTRLMPAIAGLPVTLIVRVAAQGGY